MYRGGGGMKILEDSIVKRFTFTFIIFIHRDVHYNVNLYVSLFFSHINSILCNSLSAAFSTSVVRFLFTRDESGGDPRCFFVPSNSINEREFDRTTALALISFSSFALAIYQIRKLQIAPRGDISA